MWYSYITTLAIWVYNEKAVVFSDISNPNTCISKIIDIIRQVVEWSEIAFSGRQNTENEHFETLKKLVHKLNFHHWTCLYKTFNLLFVFYYSSNLNLQWESGRLCRNFKSQHKYIQNHWLIRPVDEWAEIAFSGRHFAENEHCEKLKKLVHKLNFHY